MEDEVGYAESIPVEKAGLEGYCKVFCEILLEYLPDAEIWAFFDRDISSHTHIFLKSGNDYVDAKGTRTLSEITAELRPKKQARRISREEMRTCVMISDDDKE